MATKMVTDLIHVRYTGDPKLIEECLNEFFPETVYPGVKCTYEVTIHETHVITMLTIRHRNPMKVRNGRSTFRNICPM